LGFCESMILEIVDQEKIEFINSSMLTMNTI
jgi:hypothetical protein